MARLASSFVCYCRRHSARFLVMGYGLLVVLVIAFLYSSVREDESIQELNLMGENLAQQHRLKQNSQNSEEAKDSVAANSDKEKRTGENDPRPVSSQLEKNILMTLVRAEHTSPLAKRFTRCVISICKHSSIKLSFHIITDTLGKRICEDTFNEAGNVCKSGLNVTYYDVDKVSKTVEPITKEIKTLFSGSNAYYTHPLFFLSTAIHHVLPQSMTHIISLDSDLLFKADIKQLFAIFDDFKASTIFGLAREQQPVYRHILRFFRDRNPGTKAGGPPPDGLTGFNSGVILINLLNMRESRFYNLLFRNNAVKEIADKYIFQGHLGDQDFYSLLNLEYSALFHILPCSWNRQLCTLWRDKGYVDVFDFYYNCSELIHVYHGNCGTKMPDE